MKQGFFLITFFTCIISTQNFCINTKGSQIVNRSNKDDDQEAQIILANIAQMLASIGTISTDPQNPSVLGPQLAKIGISFIGILTEVFRNPELLNLEGVHGTKEFQLTEDMKKELESLVCRYSDLYIKRNQ